MKKLTATIPAIVWGLETQIGVAIVRELGRAGVPVVGLAAGKDSIGLRSKYLVEGMVAQPKGPELLKQIRGISDRLGACVLLAISEGNIKYLAENRDQFGKAIAVAPSLNALAAVLDKSNTLALATEIGIAIPSTVEPHDGEVTLPIAETLKYPVVLKWKDSNYIQPLLQTLNLPYFKAEYAYSWEELHSILRRYVPVGQWPLIQEYCPGYGLGQFFFMHEGKALRRFQHRRVCEWPPEGGASCVCEAVSLQEHRELQEQSIALLKAIGWEGVAMVEYRYDPVARQATLMEINGRFWGSFPLSVHCGAGFAQYAYNMQGLGKAINLPEPRTDLRLRMVLVEIKRLFRILFQAHEIQDKNFIIKPLGEIIRFILDYINPKSRYCLFAMDDIGPCVADIANMTRRVCAKKSP